MLIRFNVKNFLSFAIKQDGRSEEFSMIAGKVRNKKEHIYDDGNLKLLKFASVYGANAAGKSNLIKAMAFMKSTVVNGLPKGHTDKYCKINEANKDKASYFEVEIKIGEKYYAYGFEVILNNSKFVSEWLFELRPNNQDRLIFVRESESEPYKLGKELQIKELVDKLKVYADDVQSDGTVLFLSVLNQNKKALYEKYAEMSEIKDVFSWMKYTLDVNFPNRPISDYSYLAQEQNVEEVYRTIAAFGTGITGFELVPVSAEKMVEAMPNAARKFLMERLEQKLIKMKQDEDIKGFSMFMRGPKDFFILDVDRNEKITCKTIRFSHGTKNVLFEMTEESDGTIRLLDLLEVLLCRENKVFVIDEIDRCLHPSLTYKFVDTFLDIADQHGVQLIVTTHESRLMDFDLLRRDEIWFVDKNGHGESSVYSLEEYNARFDQKIDKAYLEGRYGGVPVFNTIFPVREG